MIDEVISILKEKSNTPNIRLNALLVLVEEFDDAFLPLLESMLTDPEEDPEVRSGVALALGKISGEKPFQILKAFFEADDKRDEMMIRRHVIEGLGMTKKEEAAPLLIQALKDKDNHVFASASEALGDLGTSALPYLVDLLFAGADDARCVAAWRLGELKDRRALPALVNAAKAEKNVEVMALCIWALGEIGLGTDEVLAILTKAKKEPEPDISRRAEMAMKKIARHLN